MSHKLHLRICVNAQICDRDSRHAPPTSRNYAAHASEDPISAHDIGEK